MFCLCAAFSRELTILCAPQNVRNKVHSGQCNKKIPFLAVMFVRNLYLLSKYEVCVYEAEKGLKNEFFDAGAFEDCIAEVWRTCSGYNGPTLSENDLFSEQGLR